MIRRLASILVGILTLFQAEAWAGEPLKHFSEAEFRALANRLAPKVLLFAEVWRQDPQAEFYGGTTRDYLYWLKGKFKDTKSRDDALEVAKKLEAEPTLDVRSFIIGDSDIDVISKQPLAIRGADYSVRKIDIQSPELFDPTHPKGKNEIDQGHIPAEKIRLSKNGFSTNPMFGDGIKEIYDGKLTVHFTAPEVFARSYYASQGLNHPILLATRFLRLQAMDYFQSYGDGFPDREKLFAIDPASKATVKAVIDSALHDQSLKPYLQKEQFRKWLNGSLGKAFRSYTNPTAAMELMEKFRITDLRLAYPGIDPFNQYLFARPKDPQRVEKNLREYGIQASELYRPVAQDFPDGHLYHGTPTEESFRGILLQGYRASAGGSAGQGLYGVNQTDKKFAETWRNSTPERLTRIRVNSDAKIVDITQGAGLSLWKRFVEKNGANYERFCRDFGIDILAYPYVPRAFVVKNSEALGQAQGVNRQVKTFSQFLEDYRNDRAPKNLESIEKMIGINRFNKPEIALLISVLEKDGTVEKIRQELKPLSVELKISMLEGDAPLRRALKRHLVPDLIDEVMTKPSSVITEEKRAEQLHAVLLMARGRNPYHTEDIGSQASRQVQDLLENKNSAIRASAAVTLVMTQEKPSSPRLKTELLATASDPRFSMHEQNKTYLALRQNLGASPDELLEHLRKFLRTQDPSGDTHYYHFTTLFNIYLQSGGKIEEVPRAAFWVHLNDENSNVRGLSEEIKKLTNPSVSDLEPLISRLRHLQRHVRGDATGNSYVSKIIIHLARVNSPDERLTELVNSLLPHLKGQEGAQAQLEFALASETPFLEDNNKRILALHIENRPSDYLQLRDHDGEKLSRLILEYARGPRSSDRMAAGKLARMWAEQNYSAFMKARNHGLAGELCTILDDEPLNQVLGAIGGFDRHPVDAEIHQTLLKLSAHPKPRVRGGLISSFRYLQATDAELAQYLTPRTFDTPGGTFYLKHLQGETPLLIEGMIKKLLSSEINANQANEMLETIRVELLSRKSSGPLSERAYWRGVRALSFSSEPGKRELALRLMDQFTAQTFGECVANRIRGQR